MKELEKYISIDSQICHGKPCFKGTRIMVSLVLEMLEGGASFDEIRDAYPRLEDNHIRTALRYAARVLEEKEFQPSRLS